MSTYDNATPPVRLAMRVEGNWWVAYLARGNSMEDAVELGRIRHRIVAEHPEIKQAFQELMSKFVADEIQRAFGVRPEMVEQSAPESERTGNA